MLTNATIFSYKTYQNLYGQWVFSGQTYIASTMVIYKSRVIGKYEQLTSNYDSGV